MLNESLRFQDADASVRRAFIRTAEQVRLPAHTQLYKWTNRPLVNHGQISPWWSFVISTRLPSGALAEGFRVAEERARRLGKSHRDYSRVRAAVSGEFRNSMDDLLIVRLTYPVWGFAGQAAGQPEFAKDQTDLQNVFLIGGAWQVWIPHLTRSHCHQLPVGA